MKNKMTERVNALQQQIDLYEYEIEEITKLCNTNTLISLDMFPFSGEAIELTELFKINCFDWCYEEDIHYRVISKKIEGLSPHQRRNSTWGFIEFKSKEDAATFKLRWKDDPDAFAQGYKQDIDDEIPF